MATTIGEVLDTAREEAEDSTEEAEDLERNSTANVTHVESMDIELPNAEATKHRRPWERSHLWPERKSSKKEAMKRHVHTGRQKRMK